MNRITLKNIKHAAFASEETHCYSASVYFNNKRVGTVKNDGHGGADYEYIEDQDGWKAMQDYIAELPPEEQYGLDQSLELICGDLVNDWLNSKDLKSLLRRCFVWQRENGEVRQCKRYKEHTVEGMESVIAKTEPTSKLLNAMPFDKALDIYKAI